MTTKTRNRLFVFLILVFPFVVLFGFLISEVITPSPPESPFPNTNTVTNSTYSPR
jgi:hypothetical protein